VGLAHGSKNASTNCTGRAGFQHGGFERHPANRPRIASLAILYGLAAAADHQVIFRVGGDPLIYSVDHGHFLPGGPGWTDAGLVRPEDADADPTILGQCGVTDGELSAPLQRLKDLVATDVAEAVAGPPDEWYFPETDRIAVAHYLWSRRDAILRKRTL